MDEFVYHFIKTLHGYIVWGLVLTFVLWLIEVAS